MTKRRPGPPWKRPAWLVCLVLALMFSTWILLHMPAGQPRISTGGAVATEQQNHRSSRSQSADQGIGRHGGPTAGQAGTQTVERTAPADKAAQVSTSSRSRRHGHGTLSPVAAKLLTFARLFAIVGTAAFLGGIIEARRWHLCFARIMRRLSRMARLPEIVGLAMPSALCSNAAANSMLVSSHAEGHIRTSALIAGGMANSYLAYVSHSLRVMYPVVGAIGLPGLLYFGIQFTGGFLVLLGVLLWNRWYVAGHGDICCLEDALPEQSPLSWKAAVCKALERMCALLFRMLCLTVPLMLGMEWLLKSGALDFWEQAMPDSVTRIFPVELLSIVAAQMGGLVQSSAVAANLRAEGLISNSQILLAMLAGSAVGNPFRTLRRNLPTAMGIFPLPVALTIVLGMQLSRLVVTLTGMALVAGIMLCDV